MRLGYQLQGYSNRCIVDVQPIMSRTGHTTGNVPERRPWTDKLPSIPHVDIFWVVRILNMPNCSRDSNGKIFSRWSNQHLEKCCNIYEESAFSHSSIGSTLRSELRLIRVLKKRRGTPSLPKSNTGRHMLMDYRYLVTVIQQSPPSETFRIGLSISSV